MIYVSKIHEGQATGECRSIAKHKAEVERDQLIIVHLLADRTIGRAYGTVCRLSVCLSVCDVLYCGKTVRPSQKLSEGVNRKPGSNS